MSPVVPQRYSERLGVIEPDQLYDAAGALGLGSVLDARPATGGLFGQNIFLDTSKGAYVLRGHPHGPDQLTKERHVARFISERSSLPSPWPYDICDDTSIFGWSFAVMPTLDGTSGETLWEQAGPEDRVELAAAAGEALARLHEATSKVFGPYDAQIDTFIEMDDFAEWWHHRFEHWRSLCRAIGSLSTDADRYIDDLLEANADALREPFQPVLVHHDFKPGNLNFDPDDDFEPTGVFDLGEAYLGDGEEDIVRMLWTVKTDEEREAFVDEYTAARPLRPGAAERLALYAVADWLVIWEYGKRHGIWFEDVGFVDSVTPIVRNARRAAE